MAEGMAKEGGGRPKPGQGERELHSWCVRGGQGGGDVPAWKRRRGWVRAGLVGEEVLQGEEGLAEVAEGGSEEGRAGDWGEEEEVFPLGEWSQGGAEP